jgi:hypothetical protein
MARNEPIGSGTEEATTDTTVLPAWSDMQAHDLSRVCGGDDWVAKYSHRMAARENERDNLVGFGLRYQQNLTV